jgi:hypothetical protein
MDHETIQTLLDLLNPLHGSLDKQTYHEKVKADFDAPGDAEYNVDVTAQQERDLTHAVCILESRLATPITGAGHIKIKYWWSEDKKWFCILSDDGIDQATVRLTVEEASLLSMNAVLKDANA